MSIDELKKVWANADAQAVGFTDKGLARNIAPIFGEAAAKVAPAPGPAVHAGLDLATLKV